MKHLPFLAVAAALGFLAQYSDIHAQGMAPGSPVRSAPSPTTPPVVKPARDPMQPIDSAYTKKILE